jgi:hypothetical protein
MDLTKLKIEQLKAMAYDQIVILEQTQRNIQVLNAEIQKRNTEPVEKTEE